MALDAFRGQTVDGQINAHLRCFLPAGIWLFGRSSQFMKLAFFRLLLAKLLVLACLLLSLMAQTAGEPERTTLLNGLRIVLLSKANDSQVLVKLRVHSGAAFDLEGKAGTIALLSDILFPDPATREYFTEEMQGQLQVNTDYDAITITMRGKASEFERIVEILRNALVSTDLTEPTFTKMRDGRVKIIKDISISPTTVADRAIATRLYGDFPYGRPSGGTVESLERVQRADLLFARERFLNPNNATLVVIGGVQRARAMRALRQLLGVWRKNEQIVPATFRHPIAPDARTLVVNAPNDQSVEIRLATRGLARNDRDAAAASVLAGVARQRWEKQVPDLARSPLFARHEAFLLPGMFVMGTTVDPLLAGKALTTARQIIKSLMSTPPTISELEQARSEVLNEMNKQLMDPDGVASGWLDMDTYAVTAPVEQIHALNLVSPDDVQRVAKRIFGEAPLASVVVGNSKVVTAALDGHEKIEVMGAVESPADNKPAKPLSTTRSKP